MNRRRAAPSHRPHRRRTASLLLAGALAVAAGTAVVAAGAAAARTRTTSPSPVLEARATSLRLPALAHQLHGLMPLGGDAPHSHPFTRVGHESPHALTAGAEISTNWSGDIEEGSGAVFTGIQGSWTVPTVQPSSSDEYSATWIGIGGYNTSTLIQTGTLQDSGPDNGGTTYEAWVELLPDPSQTIVESAAPAPVRPGDQMNASISQDPSTLLWTIQLDDTTQNWSFSQQFSYPPAGDPSPSVSAEWIEEAPTLTVNDVSTQATLADYGSTTFTDLAVAGSGLASAQSVPTYLESTSTGAIVSYPANFDSSTHSFSTYYGSPAPQVTSVTPDQGSTAGGTSVTIGGNFVTGVTAVSVGGTSVPFSPSVHNGTVTVTTPPHPASTVDVTVTTPGGTSQVTTADEFTFVAPPPAPPHGYWLVGSDGGIFSFGSAQFYGSTGSLRLQRPVVGIVPTADRGGYWLDASDGGVFAFGDAGFYGSIPGLGLHPAGSGLPDSLNAPVVGMVPSADGGGYFMVASDGGVFAFGDAHFAGSCPGIGGCSGAAVAVMPDASGAGYWVVTQTGHVYTFGDAPYFGAPGPQDVPVTSAVRTPDGQGYWILFANGAIAAYGDAASFGSPTGQFGGFNPATAVFATSDGAGYWVAGADGAVDAFGDAPNDGSMAGTDLNGSIIAAAGW